MLVGMGRTALLWGMWVAIIALPFGCSDSSSGSDDEVDTGAGADAGPMAPDVTVAPNGPRAPGARELVIEGEVNRLVPVGQSIDLALRYVQGPASDPVANARVSARIEDSSGVDQTAGGVEGTGLGAVNATTDASGRAIFTVTARPDARSVSFRVIASTTDAPEVRWNVTVAQAGSGGLAVVVTYNCPGHRYGYADIVAVNLSVFDQQNCAQLQGSAAELPPAYLGAEIRPYSDVDNRESIGDLGDGATFSVTAQGLSADGNILTFGCVDNIRVTAGSVTSATLDMCDLDLAYKGQYLVENQFDFSSVLNESDNPTLQTIGEALEVIGQIGGGGENPETGRGDAVIEMMCRFADFSEGTCDVVRQLTARVLHELITQYTPPQVLAVLDALGDIYRLASQFTVIGEIEFVQERADASGMLNGNDNRWQKFRFVWRTGCPMGTIEACTREYTLGELGLDRRTIAGAFNAQLTGATQVHVMPHGLTVEYGPLLLALAEHWIIPTIMEVEGPVTLEDVLALIPCEDINASLPGGNPNSGLCEDVLVDALARVVREQLSELTFTPEQFSLEGDVQAADIDGDLRIDKLQNGVWRGTVLFGESSMGFNGSFVGCRRPGPGQPCEL